MYFIDEGFFSVVGSSHLRPLDEKFATMLPSQAFHCIMGGVQPIEALQKTNKNDLGFRMYHFILLYAKYTLLLNISTGPSELNNRMPDSKCKLHLLSSFSRRTAQFFLP